VSGTKKTAAEANPPPHVIEPTAIYFPDQVRALFRLRPHTLAREIRQRRLRVSKRAGRYFFLGAWLLAWVEGGEVKSSPDGPRAVAS